MMSVEESSLGGPEEDIVAAKLRICLTEIYRNKNTTRTRYTDLGGSGGLYIAKFNNIRKVLGKNRTETGSVVVTPPGGTARWARATGWSWPPGLRFLPCFNSLSSIWNKNCKNINWQVFSRT